MITPTHAAVIAYNDGRSSVTVTYGTSGAIDELVTNDLGGSHRVPFRHPEKGFVYYFKQIGEPEIHALNGISPNSLRNRIKNEVKKKGLKIVKADTIYSPSELTLIEVSMGMNGARTTEPPYGLYTKGLGTCMGISIHNRETHYTYLIHTPGCEEWDMPIVLNHLARKLAEQKTEAEVQVEVASGFVTAKDEEIVETIMKARAEVVKFLQSRSLNPKLHFAERDEAFAFMSINPHNGLVDLVKKPVGYRI